MHFFIYLIIFFAFFDLFAQLPIMSPLAVSLGATPFLTGLVVGMYSLSNTIGNLISGIYSDRRGPFSILIIGLLLTGGILFSYSLAEGPYTLLLIRFLHGIAAGLIVPAAFTYLANRTDYSRRGKGAAISGAFIGLAAITGPAFSAVYASRTSASEVMAATGSILFLLGITAFFTLNRTAKKKTAALPQSVVNSKLTGNQKLIQAFSGAFFLMFSQGVLAYLLPLKVQNLNFDPQMSGLLLSTFGISAILVFLLPINRIFDKSRPVYTLIAGLLLMSGSLLVLSAVSTAALLYLTMCTYGWGFAFLFPSLNSLLVDSTTTQSRGRAYGYFYAFFSVGVVAGSSLTGALQVTANEGFVLSGVLLLVAATVNAAISKAEKRRRPCSPDKC